MENNGSLGDSKCTLERQSTKKDFSSLFYHTPKFFLPSSFSSFIPLSFSDSLIGVHEKVFGKYCTYFTCLQKKLVKVDFDFLCNYRTTIRPIEGNVKMK